MKDNSQGKRLSPHSHRYDASRMDSFKLRRIEPWRISCHGALPLYPYWMEEEIRVGKFWYRENFSRFGLVTILLEGSILFRFDHRKIRLEAGEILVIPKGMPYSFENTEEPQAHKVVLEFIGKNLVSDLETLALNRPAVIATERCGGFADQARRIGDLLHEKDPARTPELVGLSYAFLTELSLARPVKRLSNSLFLDAQMLLESEFERKLSLAELAVQLNTTPARLNRIFHQELGTPPMQYRIEKKMELAKHLLVNTKLAVKEIAFRLGYCDQFYFSREFRRVAGCSPREAREKGILL